MCTEVIQKSGWLKNIEQVKSKLNEKLDGKQLDSVELLGGGWRVPRVLKEIEQVFAPASAGQKCNADECVANGAAMVAANYSSVYKFKPLIVATLLEEDIQVSIEYYDNSGNKVTEDASFPSGSLLGSRKKRVVATDSSIRVVVRDADAKVLDVHVVSGLDVVKKVGVPVCSLNLFSAQVRPQRSSGENSSSF